jgi:hypothetical protein
MEAVTGRRIYWLGGAMLAAYAVSLLLIGIAAGFDHGTTQWLWVAGLAALATGMTASALVHLAVVVGDRQVRDQLWARASQWTRAWRVFFLIARIAAALVMWNLAFGIVHR